MYTVVNGVYILPDASILVNSFVNIPRKE